CPSATSTRLPIRSFRSAATSTRSCASSRTTRSRNACCSPMQPGCLESHSAMPYVQTESGNLYYEVIDLVAPWETRRDTIIFHHGIGASAGIWQEWLPDLIDRYRIVTFE